MITKFLEQDDELEAFITGPAGSGKTTYLYGVIETLNKLGVTYKVVAYTHKAKDILVSKLPKDTDISTLHSFLKKRPGINEKAKHIRALMTNSQRGKPEVLELLVIDEFSFVGEKDYMSLGDLQDSMLLTTYTCKECGQQLDSSDEQCICSDEPTEIVEESIKPLKVLYVGDLNQLSPVDGPPAVYPHEPFWERLTTIHRSTSDISIPLSKLVDMIEGKKPMSYLEPTKSFLRNKDIDKLYKLDDSDDKIMLCYTNKAVENHNISIQGYKTPRLGDILYCPSLKKTLELVSITDKCSTEDVLTTVVGDITKDTKYNPMKVLNSLKYVKFYTCYDVDTGNRLVIPGIFGSYQNKLIRSKLGKNLVELNKQGKDSKKVYKEYKAINDYVSILDFNHCMTIHKSQGSEYQNVYVDSEDLSICIDKNERMKLLYVAMSRSKDKIFLNN